MALCLTWPSRWRRRFVATSPPFPRYTAPRRNAHHAGPPAREVYLTGRVGRGHSLAPSSNQTWVLSLPHSSLAFRVDRPSHVKVSRPSKSLLPSVVNEQPRCSAPRAFLVPLRAFVVNTSSGCGQRLPCVLRGDTRPFPTANRPAPRTTNTGAYTPAASKKASKKSAAKK